MSSLHKKLMHGFILIIAIFLSSCASTKTPEANKIESFAVWKDGSYKGGIFKKLMVVTVLDNQLNGRLLEAALAEELQKNGIEAVASTIALGAKEFSKQNIIEAAKEHQVDGIVAARLSLVDQSNLHQPPSYYAVPESYAYRWDTYFPHMYDAVSPSYVATYKSYYVDTSVFAATTQSLVWMATFQTLDPNDFNTEAINFSRNITFKLQQSGIVQ